jgi:hypothetical protein
MLWEPVRPFIERAMAESAYDEPYSVYEAVKEERAVLWVVWDAGEILAVVVTQLSTTPKSKACGIWICTGNGRENWQELITEIEDYARREECTLMRHSARTGWARVLKPHGYKMTHAILEKAL